MGTDAYMRWEQMRKSDENMITACMYQIDSGKYGYIRCNSNMAVELEVMRDIFNDVRLWDGEYHEYDFFGNADKMLDTIKQYCVLKMEQIDAGRYDDAFLMKPIHPDRDMNIRIGRRVRMAECFKWSASIVGFFELGLMKQEMGRIPMVKIVK